MYEYEMIKEVNEITDKVRWSVYRKRPFWNEYGKFHWRWLAQKKLKRLQVAEAWARQSDTAHYQSDTARSDWS